MRKLNKTIKPITPDLKYNLATQEHYLQHKIQPIQFVQENNIGWCAGNVIKYICRENKKNGVEDLKKALEYLKCLIYYKETGKFLPPDRIKKLKRSWR